MKIRSWASFALVAGLLVFSGAAQAAPSWATFAYSDNTHITQLQLNTTTGTVTLTSTVRGWVDASGTNNGASAINNYIAGACGSSDSCGGSNLENRNWFAFQMPAGVNLTVTSATLLLPVPAPTSPKQGVYPLSGPIVYTLYDVTSPAATFTGGTAGAAQFTDLGTGAVYGTRNYTLADQGTTPGIALTPAAITWLNTQNGQSIVLGGAVTSQAAQAIPAPASSVVALLLLGAGLLFVVGLMWRNRSSQA